MNNKGKHTCHPTAKAFFLKKRKFCAAWFIKSSQVYNCLYVTKKVTFRRAAKRLLLWKTLAAILWKTLALIVPRDLILSVLHGK